jgi:hypothetical protein
MTMLVNKNFILSDIDVNMIHLLVRILPAKGNLLKMRNHIKIKSKGLE